MDKRILTTSLPLTLPMLILALTAPLLNAAESNGPIVGWEDYIVQWGGTDPAFSTPQAIQNVMERWKGRGYTDVYWRTGLAFYDPCEMMIYTDHLHPLTYGLMNIIEEASARFQVTHTAQLAAEAVGLKFWAWNTNVYMDGAADDSNVTFPWGHAFRYIVEHPEVLTIDRQGNPYYSVREYAYPDARANKVDEYEYMANTYGTKNFYASMRPEAEQMQDPPRHGDQFGFNQPVVDEMLARYGVDILNDPRFDIDDPGFDPQDAMVNNWRDLRGEYLTQFWRDLRTAMDAIDPDINILTRIRGGDYVGPSLGNWRVDWRTWIEEGLIDELMIWGNLGVDPDAANKDYLLDTYSSSTFRNFINNSSHPETRLVAAGQWCYTPLPTSVYPGIDGWRTDWTTEARDLAWYQRWEMWKKDIHEFGGIRYIKQDFDEYPDTEPGYDKGWGYVVYDNTRRLCPGYWYTMGTAVDELPRIQSTIRHGTVGKALELTYSRRSTMSMYTRHWSDSHFLDPSINGGALTMTFWLYRPYSSSSVSLKMQYDGAPSEGTPGVMIGNSTGTVYYYQNGTWAATPQSVGLGAWEKITVQIDLNAKTYSIFLGANAETQVCSDIAYPSLTNRFNQLYWMPHGGLVYLDDVEWLWSPDNDLIPRGAEVYLVDDFEAHDVDATVSGAAPDQGSTWQVWPTTAAADFYIENTLSFGDGYKCLAARRNSGALIYNNSGSRLSLEPGEVITFDCDLFLPSPSSVGLYFAEDLGGPYVASVYINGGKWYYWDPTAGSYINTNVTFNYQKWVHVQIALDVDQRLYKVILQSPCQMPQLIATVPWSTATQVHDEVMLLISPQGANGQLSYLDNIVVTHGLPDACGSESNPYPLGDLTHNCQVNPDDLAIMSLRWLDQGGPADINSDNRVDLKDLALLAHYWFENGN